MPNGNQNTSNPNHTNILNINTRQCLESLRPRHNQAGGHVDDTLKIGIIKEIKVTVGIGMTLFGHYKI